MGFWEKVKEIFQKKESEFLEDKVRDDNLLYRGDEPECWACNFPIHKSQRYRRLEGKKMHKTCFKKLKKIAKNGMSLNGF